MSEMQSVITGAVIPKDLAGVDGLETGFCPPSANQSRLLITGSPGAGKSTLLNSNPKLLMIDVERGGKTVADPKAMRFSAPATTDPKVLDQAYLEFINRIVARRIKGATDIEMIGIDSMDEFVDIFLTAYCLRLGVDDPIQQASDRSGNIYTMARKDICMALDQIHRSGMGWAIVGHSVQKTLRINGQDTQVSGLAMSDSFRSVFHRKCEHFLYVEPGVELIPQPPIVKIVGGKRHEKPVPPEAKPVRFLKTAPGGIWKGVEANELKVRVPLPSRVRLPQIGGFEAFSKAYYEAVAKLMETKNV
jgi:energy-coupling factor transporter ATP-binding protein EcfA2